MKILGIFISADPRTQGGIQTFGRNLKKFYKEMVFITQSNPYKKIYEVKNIRELKTSNIIFKIMNKLMNNSLRNYLIRREIKKDNWDIIFFCFPHELKILKPNLEKKINAKKILVQHFNFNHFEFQKEEIKKLMYLLDYYIVLSPYDKNKFQKGFDLPEEKVRVIRHTCDIEILKEKKEKNKTLIMMARIDNYQKRFDLAIKAMKKLPDFVLKIYGEIHIKSDLNYLNNILKRENITNVFFEGGTNKVQEKLDEASIFIMTSDYEGYGITNIEAMRRGLPIILRNTFEAAEDIVVNNENGILLEKKWDEDKFVEAVRKIYDNYEYYSENAKRLGKRYDKEIIKEEWDKILGRMSYENIINSTF